MAKNLRYERTFFIDKKKRDEEREQVKSLVSLLPKVKIQSRKEDYLASLDDADKRRFLLREYFKKLKKKRPSFSVNKKLAWVVASTPFPQLFEYREGDAELFKNCNTVKFSNFLSAYKLYKSLIKFEYDRVKSLCRAADYKNPRKEEP